VSAASRACRASLRAASSGETDAIEAVGQPCRSLRKTQGCCSCSTNRQRRTPARPPLDPFDRARPRHPSRVRLADLAQITDRYGRLAATVVNNHRGKLALSRITDLGTWTTCPSCSEADVSRGVRHRPSRRRTVHPHGPSSGNGSHIRRRAAPTGTRSRSPRLPEPAPGPGALPIKHEVVAA